MAPGFTIHTELACTESYRLYRGLRERDGNAVLLKVAADGASGRSTLQRELEITRTLSGASVLAALEIVDHGEAPALVLEDPGGFSLEAALTTHTPSILDSLNIAATVAGILAVLDERGITHNDLSPHSIWLHDSAAGISLTHFGRAACEGVAPCVNQGPRDNSLAYRSPEIIGRTRRRPDHRSDFYSLGVVLYRLLTGVLPFASDDPVELLHAQVATEALSPRARKPHVPPILSDLVMKLLSKDAGERYRSAAGLLHDLDRCRRGYAKNGHIAAFRLAAKDLSTRLEIGTRLFGRDEEITRLRGAYTEVQRGSTERALVLVHGYSGIGKTSLINELQTPLLRDHGHFASGKYDQLRRNVPYASLIQAFQGLVQQLLGQSEERLAEWRCRLLDALGVNGRVIVDIIPQLEGIIGPQPELSLLGPAENQNRFNRAFLAFSSALCSAGRPLVLFIDDLQWADLPTLTLLRLMLLDPGHRSLLLVGAYRDNEVDTAHPLTKLLRELPTEVTTHDLALSSLSAADVQAWLADVLGCSVRRAHALATVVHEKTQGNPFFMTMFVRMLHQEKQLRFDHAAHRWRWALARIKRLAITDNVVDLMIRRIREWDPPMQAVISVAASLGAQFDLRTLELVNERSDVECRAALRSVCSQGLIVPASDLSIESALGGHYKFLHDRVQQAAYTLIPEKARPALHRHIGQLLLRTLDGADLDKRLFELVEHLARGAELFENDSERTRFAELALAAARKAKLSSAYEPGLRYLLAGLNCLPRQSWRDNYALAFAYLLEKGELEYLLAQWDVAIATFDEALAHAATLLDRCRVNQFKVMLYRAKNELRTSLDIALATLQELGVPLHEPTDVELEYCLERFNVLTAADDEILVQLPELEDPHKLAAMLLMREAMNGAFFVGSKLLFTISMKMVEITIEFGNSPHAAVAYVYQAAFMLSGRKHDYPKAERFGKLAWRLNERRYHVKPYEAIVLDCLGGFVTHHTQDVATAISQLERGYCVALENGMYTWVGYCAINALYLSFWGPYTLAEIRNRIDGNLPWLARFDPNMASYFRMFRMVIDDLTQSAPGLAPSPLDPVVLAGFQRNEDQIGLLVHCTSQLSLANWLDDTRSATSFANAAESYGGAGTGMFLEAAFHFHRSLAYADAVDTADSESRARYMRCIHESKASFDSWARHSPTTYVHMQLLLAAELARLAHDTARAMDLYDQAIAAADAAHFAHNAALASERTARFYFDLGRAEFAHIYLRGAHTRYVRWGAHRKAEELLRRYPGVLTPKARALPSAVDRELEFSAIVRASQTLSEELQLEQLLRKLLTIAIQHAGAQQGYLLLMRNEGLRIAARRGSAAADVSVFVGATDEDETGLPLAVVNYVRRTREALLLSNACEDPRFSGDPKVERLRPKSILCLPILHRRRLVGVLHLQNDLTTDAFPPSCVEVLHVLLAQAAISLETARVYEEMQREVVERKRAEQSLQQSYESLEDRVSERTRALTVANAQLQREINERVQAEEALGQRLAMEDAIARISTRFINLRLVDFDSVIDEALLALARFIGADRSCLAIFREDEPALMYAHPRQDSVTCEHSWMQAARSHDHWVLRQLRGTGTVIVAEVSDLPGEAREFRLELEAAAVRSAIYLALTDGEETLGFLGFESVRQRPWAAEEDIKLLRMLGDIVVNALARVRGEQRQRRAKEDAEAANKAKSGFLANMSHELRTPLNAILGYAQVLQRDASLVAEQRRQVDIIERSGEHLLALINDVLDLAKIESGRHEVVLAEFRLPQFLTEVASIARVRADQAGLAFRYDAPRELPELVLGDARKTRQVVLNLLGNAVKFTTTGEVALRVRWQERAPSSGELTMEVEDTGIGIQADKLEEIFLPFRQLTSQGRVTEGTGLGLSISRRLARMMAGDVTVVSTPGRGSLFAFVIPLSKVSAEKPLATAPLPRLTRLDGRGKNVLIVDDRAENRSVLMALLRPLGFEVREATQGREALQSACAVPPDLILMDLIMPDMDGLEATRLLRSTPGLQDIAIIAVTARAFEQDRLASLAAGCNEVIPKPVNAERLLQAIAAQLGLTATTPPAAAEPAAQAVSLPPAAAQALYESALLGDVVDLLRLLDDIEAGQPELGALISDLRDVARQYDMRRIRGLVQPHLRIN
jgi:predicted ATPase/signal transduction histidine kinase/CheY-like chemotaxis protein